MLPQTEISPKGNLRVYELPREAVQTRREPVQTSRNTGHGHSPIKMAHQGRYQVYQPLPATTENRRQLVSSSSDNDLHFYVPKESEGNVK